MHPNVSKWVRTAPNGTDHVRFPKRLKIYKQGTRGANFEGGAQPRRSAAAAAAAAAAPTPWPRRTNLKSPIPQQSTKRLRYVCVDKYFF